MSLQIQNKSSKSVIAEGTPADKSAFVFEGNWYFDPAHVDMSHLKVTDRTYTCPYKGVCYWIDLESADLQVRNVGWVYNSPKPGFEMIKDHIGFYARDTAGTLAVRSEEIPA
ncbi:MAG: DUF427 domain-containing protein [Chloroflexi bacterium]|nr:DUF427 domain-containing protein [Chloroflexota bacterium]